MRIQSSLLLGSIAAAVCALAIVLFSPPALAYIGPGAGITAIGALFALVAALFLAVVGFIWYPFKRLLRRKRAKAPEKVQQ